MSRDAAVITCDRGYLRPQRRWREQLADALTCELVQVESDVVVPVELASDKKETAARTLRPKITRHLERFLGDLPKAEPTSSGPVEAAGEDLTDLDGLLDQLRLDRSVPPVPPRPRTASIRFLG